VGFLAKLLGGVAGAALLFLVVTPTGRYLLRAGYEEARILARRQPIERLVTDTTLDAATRDKLRLVQEARRFAVDSLGLTADESFTTYSYVDSDTLVLVVSAAYRDRLAMRTRWWPVVGRVPYQGYFDFAAAHKERDALEAAGFDAEIRPASAFSTLGWFNDPLLNTTLRADSTYLVETVIHELVHSTVWIPGDAVFNESFANFVGVHGAAWFFRARGDTAAAARVLHGWAQERTLGDFYQRTYASLRDAFDARPGDSLRTARLAVRDSVFARARQHLADSVAPALDVTDSTWAAGVRLNNATVMARRVYRTGLPWFDAVLERHEGDLRAAWEQIAKVALEAPRGGAYAAVETLAR
jgi:predicted aminopeptidase